MALTRRSTVCRELAPLESVRSFEIPWRPPLSTLTIGANNQSGSFDGTIEGPLTGGGDIAITKVGSGLLTLGGPNHYAGATTIEAGELAVTGRLATLGLVGASGAVLVNTSPTGGATLSGRGDGATTGLVGNVTLAAINSGNRARIAPARRVRRDQTRARWLSIRSWLGMAHNCSSILLTRLIRPTTIGSIGMPRLPAR